MNRIETLEAQLIALRQQVARLESQILSKGGGGPVDESVAARLAREFGASWEDVTAGKKDVKTSTARACVITTLHAQAGWTARRIAVTLRMNERNVRKSFGKALSRDRALLKTEAPKRDKAVKWGK